MTKNSKDIFSGRNKDWWNNACINFMIGRGAWTGYSMGYKKGADILSEYVYSEQQDQDILVFPILFLYRHYLELIIKEILIDCSKIMDEKISFKHHNILEYWKIIKEMCKNIKIKEVLGGDIPKNMIFIIDNIVEQFEKVDSKSDAFRYPTNKDGLQNLGGIIHINIKQVSEELNKVYEQLEAISSALNNAVQMKADYEASIN